MKSMKRIHIPNRGPDQLKVPIAIAIGIKECKNLGTDGLALITPLKDNLDSIVVGAFLGSDVSRRLMKGAKIPIGDHGVSISHYSVSTVLRSPSPRVGLAFYVSSKNIKKLDDLSFDCLIFVPWLDKDGKNWASKWGAETYGEETPG